MDKMVTTAQAARIFARYLYAQAEDSNGRIGQIRMIGEDYVSLTWNDPDPNNPHEKRGSVFFRDAKLRLTPLSKVTKMDADMVANLAGLAGNNAAGVVTNAGKELVRKIARCLSLPDHLSVYEILSIFEYLSLREYDLPNFIAPDHPYNGMTAVDLGLAKAVEKMEPTF